MGKLTARIFLAALDIAAIVMLVVSAVYVWTISGFILLAFVAVQYIVQTVYFIARNGLIGLVSPVVLVVLGIAVAFPIIIAGMNAPAVSALFVLGAVAALLSSAYTFAGIK